VIVCCCDGCDGPDTASLLLGAALLLALGGAFILLLVQVYRPGWFD